MVQHLVLDHLRPEPEAEWSVRFTPNHAMANYMSIGSTAAEFDSRALTFIMVSVCTCDMKFLCNMNVFTFTELCLCIKTATIYYTTAQDTRYVTYNPKQNIVLHIRNKNENIIM